MDYIFLPKGHGYDFKEGLYILITNISRGGREGAKEIRGEGGGKKKPMGRGKIPLASP